ncbi:hypothetical protein [Ramlibacter sp.]|uniref:hypothetical protein n=1 Tax=Ramlibacter sp. TaxID=1917967 RepID=UPI0035AE641A
MIRRLMWSAWPAFLAACALELLVFAFVDPMDVQWSGNAVGLSRQGIYTAAFFAFWLVSLAACFLTTVLAMSAAEVNACPFDADQRPEGCPGRGC